MDIAYSLLNSKPIEYWRVGAVKVATEKDSNLLSSKEVTMATKPQPTSRHLSATLKGKYQCVELMCGREGGKSKQAS